MSFSRLINSEDHSRCSDVFSDEFESTPEVGVGILNFNGTSDTINSLDSIINSTSLPTIVTIIENGSSISQKEQLYNQIEERGRHQRKLQVESEIGSITLDLFEGNDAWILIVDSKLNIGFCSGNNLAVECLDSLNIPYALIINNDAELRSNCIEYLYETITTEDNIAAVSPVIYDQNGDLWYTGGDYSKWNYQYKRSFEADENGYIDQVQSNQHYRTNLYSGACVLFDTETYCKEGGMYDPLFISIDEPEFSRHLRENGYSIAVEPRGEAIHQLNETLGSAGSKYHDYFYVRNFLIYSYVHNSYSDHAAFFIRQFSNYLTPFIHSTSSSRSNRARTGVSAIIDYFRGRWGPGRWWDELNTLQYTHDLWRPSSQWNKNRRI